MSNIGLIQIYTGDGKGKTTAALGLALRALGWNKKVCIIQFVKGDKEIGEIKISKSHIPQLSFHQLSNNKKFILKANKKDKEIAQKTWEFAKKEIFSNKFDLIILDEINVAINLKLIDLKDLFKVFKNKPQKLELVLTGRNASKKLIKKADLVTEMKMIKHPFYKKIPARKGIEY